MCQWLHVHAKLAAMREVSRRTISRTVKEDLGYKSFCLRVRHHLMAQDKDKRVIRGKALISSLKSTGSTFSSSLMRSCSMLCFMCTHNHQNKRWICQDAGDVPMVLKTKYLAGVLVLGVVSSEDHVMPSHFSVGLKINQKVYRRILEEVLFPWMKRVAGGRKFTFQQDSAPAHKAKEGQSWLLGAVPHF